MPYSLLAHRPSRRRRTALAFAAGFLLAGAAHAQNDLLITGIIDGPLAGGTPKAVELYVVNDVADLSTYGVGSANNGGGSDGVELALSGSAVSGSFLYVATEAPNFTAFFGFAPTFTGGVVNVNGDDAIELFYDPNGVTTGGSPPPTTVVVDVFGDPSVSGTGEAWDYLDGWAYRVDETGPDGATFVVGHFSYSGPNALDGEMSNATAGTPFPIGTYSAGASLPAVTCSSAAPLLFSAYDADPADGSVDPRGEFVELMNDAGDGTAVDLSGCDFVVFDPFDETVTYAADAQDLLGDGETHSFANVVLPEDGQTIPPMTLPDGPGAFALVAGSASVGQSVGDLLADADVVAAVVYLDDATVFGSVRGGGDPEVNAQAMVAALVSLHAVAAEEAGSLDPSVVVAPNPVSGAGSVAFGQAEAADVRVALYDVLGREVAVLAEGTFAAGRHTVPLITSGVPPGAYVVRVAGSGTARTARLTVVR